MATHSIEEKVEDYYKDRLKALGIRNFAKTERMGTSIDRALDDAPSKGGGTGPNYPDLRVLLTDDHSRRIPVMIEAKGLPNRLVKTDKDGNIVQTTVYAHDSKPNRQGVILHHKGDLNYGAVKEYAVNGALHYGKVLLDANVTDEVLIIGVNGTELDARGRLTNPECQVWYVAKRNQEMPKRVEALEGNWTLMKAENIDRLFAILDDLSLTEAEREALKQKAEADLENSVKTIHQHIYEDKRMNMLGTNEKLYLFCGLIMAGLPITGQSDLEIDDLHGNAVGRTDGRIVMQRISDFLDSKQSTADKKQMIVSLFAPTFGKQELWNVGEGATESILKELYVMIKTEIIPIFREGLNIDFTGKILNSLSDWVSIADDKKNDVVLTPRYVTKMMAIMARTDKDSFVWDSAMGSAGFLVSAMDIMMRDAERKISDKRELKAKQENIKKNQLLGIEILGPVYILAVLNMILMGDESSKIINGDSHLEVANGVVDNFPATVYLLNPPYSAPGKGFVFVKEALEKMTKGYACILIQENAGSGQGLPYTRQILEHNTLLASIHMPSDLFGGKASVQASIYLFKVGRPHEIDDMVTFIDMSNDGYARQNRKKSTQAVNLRNTDHADERYAEVEAIVLGKKPRTHYYTEGNGLVIRDTITLDGNDWTYNQHRVVDTKPTERDFKKTVSDYLSFLVSQLLQKASSSSDGND